MFDYLGLDACLYDETLDTYTWVVDNASYQELNNLRRFLESSIETVAIGLAEIAENSGVVKDEIVVHRLGLIPIVADIDALTTREDECSETSCVVFGLYKRNKESLPVYVTSEDLVWFPSQGQDMSPPYALYPDFIITRLLPGQIIDLKAYAFKGTADDHVRWSSIYSSYGQTTNAKGGMYPCIPCADRIKTSLVRGVGCYYFSIKLTGGITIDQVMKQVRDRYLTSQNPRL